VSYRQKARKEGKLAYLGAKSRKIRVKRENMSEMFYLFLKNQS